MMLHYPFNMSLITKYVITRKKKAQVTLQFYINFFILLEMEYS